MTWTKTVLMMTALFGCSERPLDNAQPPPQPPSAELWPLGGRIYHGQETPSQPEVSTDPATATDPALEQPVDGLPVDGDPIDVAPEDGLPVDVAPEDGLPVDGVPEAPAFEEPAPETPPATPEDNPGE